MAALATPVGSANAPSAGVLDCCIFENGDPIGVVPVVGVDAPNDVQWLVEGASPKRFPLGVWGDVNVH